MGGLTGLPLGLGPADVLLHDTYYVIGHFHYLVAPGTLLALFGGIYHWFPKVTGRRLNDGLARWHFWGSFVSMNGVFFPMFLWGWWACRADCMTAAPATCMRSRCCTGTASCRCPRGCSAWRSCPSSGTW